MKKMLIVAAIAGTTTSFAANAQSQGSVMLYGLIDASISYTNNAGGAARWGMNSGNVSGSRWGLRGAEALGHGINAIFVLENGFSVADGTSQQQGRQFGRQAFVGLSSTQAGTLTLGRQYDSVVDFLAPLALPGGGYGGTMANHPYDNDNLNASVRFNNTVKYTSLNYSGLRFGGMYSFSNAAGQFANNRAFSAGVAYQYAGFNIAGSYLQVDNTNTNASTGAVGTAPIVAGRERVWGAGLNYAFGPAVVGFLFTQSKFDNATGLNYDLSATTALPSGSYVRFNNYEVNGRYNLTSAWNVSGGYTFTQGRESGFGSSLAGGNASPKFHTVTLMSTYALSKRTDVYVEGAYMRYSGTNYLGGAAIGGAGGPSSTNKQVAVALGMRHRF